jgi:two-component system CheB/CheR fusion protein
VSEVEDIQSATEQEELRQLLEFVHRSRGFDFSGYKKTSLQRRLQKRMQEVGVSTYGQYLDHLEVNPDEFSDLFNTLLINVTSFFRDRPAWSYLSEDVIPGLVADGSDLIRVWCAGCATGEEAYTIAMILAEALGEEKFRERVKIYATDVDENALNHARHATYSRDALKGVPSELLERYFEANTQGLTFRTDLRRSVIFGRNDLIQDAPISRVDLLVSRNVLMYFTAEAQSHILERFNFALSERGFLFLGKSEMLITHGDLFSPHNLKWRVFRKVARGQLRDRLAFIAASVELGSAFETERYAEMRSGAFALASVAQILVSRSGFVVDINQRARDLFGVSPADIGRPFQDLVLSYRPVDLRSAIEQAYEISDTVVLSRVPWRLDTGEQKVLDVTVRLVPGHGGLALGAAIAFQDVTAFTALTEEHEERKRELEAAYEELQSTVEELETTNEELQSTNEELETTNEELQSTNEELETMNEELQSTNDELETMNTDQQERSHELDRVNMFLEGILASLRVGVVVLDGSRTIQMWNGESTELWGVRPNEADGRSLSELDIGLPVAEVEELLDAVLERKADADHGARRLDAVNRRGRHFTCVVRALPLVTAGKEVTGALLLMADSGAIDQADGLLFE